MFAVGVTELPRRVEPNDVAQGCGVGLPPSDPFVGALVVVLVRVRVAAQSDSGPLGTVSIAPLLRWPFVVPLRTSSSVSSPWVFGRLCVIQSKIAGAEFLLEGVSVAGLLPSFGCLRRQICRFSVLLKVEFLLQF